MGATPSSVRIGTAGWGIPRAIAHAFDGDGPQLERYANVLGCTEINTTFSRTHRPDTFKRWAMSTPEDFRFSVKLPKAFTHEARLKVPSSKVTAFVTSLAGLGERLAVLLVQLPPPWRCIRQRPAPFSARFMARFRAASSANPGTPAGSQSKPGIC